VKRANLLERYRNGGQSRATGGAGRRKQWRGHRPMPDASLRYMHWTTGS